MSSFIMHPPPLILLIVFQKLIFTFFVSILIFLSSELLHYPPPPLPMQVRRGVWGPEGVGVQGGSWEAFKVFIYSPWVINFPFDRSTSPLMRPPPLPTQDARSGWVTEPFWR